jgi:hypothetical protein
MNRKGREERKALFFIPLRIWRPLRLKKSYE